MPLEEAKQYIGKTCWVSWTDRRGEMFSKELTVAGKEPWKDSYHTRGKGHTFYDLELPCVQVEIYAADIAGSIQWYRKSFFSPM